MIKGEHGAVIG